VFKVKCLHWRIVLVQLVGQCPGALLDGVALPVDKVLENGLGAVCPEARVDNILDLVLLSFELWAALFIVRAFVRWGGVLLLSDCTNLSVWAYAFAFVIAFSDRDRLLLI
jgi:hypothetical protein